MKQYFLFGSDAVRIYLEDGIETLLATPDNCFGLFEWTESSTPEQLLDAADGWFDWCSITEEDFNQLSTTS